MVNKQTEGGQMETYSNLHFAAVNTLKSTDYNELKDAVKSDYQYNSHTVDFSQLDITDEGYLQWLGNENQMTQAAFKALCRRLHIPDPFAKQINWDLLKHNITELSRTSDKQCQIFTRKSDGVVVNVANDMFIPLANELFLNELQKLSPTIKRGVLSDNLMEIDITQPRFGDLDYKDLEIEKGDIIESGFNLNNSPTGHLLTNAKQFLLRLVCTNGMTMPSREGFVKLRNKFGRNIDNALDNFLYKLGEMAMNTQGIEDQIKSLNRPLNVLEYAKYYKGIQGIIKDEDYTDTSIFKIDKDQRLIYLAQDRAYKKGVLSKLEKTNLNGYSVLNRLTDKAKSFDQDQRQKLEAYAGQMIAGQEAQA
tara:strand:- start:189 stop:1280 length:1092 start_codon:yes stop_codon:yes gene_type:complete